jgi:hypothetical protein
VFIFTGQLDLYQQIDCSPDRVEPALAIEPPVHQHGIDVNEVLGRAEQILDDFLP